MFGSSTDTTNDDIVSNSMVDMEACVLRMSLYSTSIRRASKVGQQQQLLKRKGLFFFSHIDNDNLKWGNFELYVVGKRLG